MRLKDDPYFLADVNNTIAELSRIHKRLALAFSLGGTVLTMSVQRFDPGAKKGK